MLLHIEHSMQVLCLCMAVLLGSSHGFQCQSCSYAYSPDNPNTDMACVFQPEVYTGSKVLKCADYCVVQEIYNKNLQRVVSYWRSCSDKAQSGYCRGNMLLTCYHSCQGDLCNSWVRGQLHVDYGNIKPPEQSGNGATSLTMTSKRFSTLSIFLWLESLIISTEGNMALMLMLCLVMM